MFYNEMLKLINKKKKVFLGGTCNNSLWRDELIKLLEIDYFNPVVDDWNDAAQERELEERRTSDYVLYTITPKMTGVYSIAELVDDSNKRPNKVIFCYLLKDGDVSFDKSQIKSIKQVAKMIIDNGVTAVFDNLSDVATYLNK